MKLNKSKDWGRILLPAFLLIISIQGVLFFPEVRVRFFPKEIWQERLRLVARGCAQVKASLTSLEADLAGLNFPSGPGLSPDINCNGNRETKDIFQVLIYAWYSMVAPTPQISFEKRHFLARKAFVHLEMKLNNLELMLDNLVFSINTQCIDGISYFSNYDNASIQKQIETLRQKCRQYESNLNIQAKRLQQIREYADKEIPHRQRNFQ
jgi:hypothetical protein